MTIDETTGSKNLKVQLISQRAFDELSDDRKLFYLDLIKKGQVKISDGHTGASGKKSESAHRTSGNISVAPMSQAPRYLPKPSGKSVTGARGKPEKSWITPKFSQEDDGRSPLPTVLERHLWLTVLQKS